MYVIEQHFLLTSFRVVLSLLEHLETNLKLYYYGILKYSLYIATNAHCRIAAANEISASVR
jgi:hypothetical protein